MSLKKLEWRDYTQKHFFSILKKVKKLSSLIIFPIFKKVMKAFKWMIDDCIDLKIIYIFLKSIIIKHKIKNKIMSI